VPAFIVSLILLPAGVYALVAVAVAVVVVEETRMKRRAWFGLEELARQARRAFPLHDGMMSTPASAGFDLAFASTLQATRSRMPGHPFVLLRLLDAAKHLASFRCGANPLSTERR
jgi:hypothetical protein